MATETLDTRERYHPRIEANFDVKVLLNGKVIPARARDLSMNGMFLRAFPLGDLERFPVILPLEGREIRVTAVVRRQHLDGVAVEFANVDWDDMIALAGYLHPRLP
jgi:hypothetical protein